MKYLFLFIFSLFSLTTLCAQEVRQSDGRQIGAISPDGTICNRSNAQIGKISSDGTIRDRNNAQIGKIESDGTVRDRSGSQVGKVKSDGTVRNRQNSQIGRASGVKKEWVAVAFFFFYFN